MVSTAQVAHIGRYIWPWYFLMLYIDIHNISYDTCFSTVFNKKTVSSPLKSAGASREFASPHVWFVYFASEGNTHYPEWESLVGDVEQLMVEWMTLWPLSLIDRYWQILIRAFRRFFPPRIRAIFINVVRNFIWKLVIFSKPHIRKTILHEYDIKYSAIDMQCVFITIFSQLPQSSF